jgi:hypothetical protein
VGRYSSQDSGRPTKTYQRNASIKYASGSDTNDSYHSDSDAHVHTLRTLMDEIELLVSETFKHFYHHHPEHERDFPEFAPDEKVEEVFELPEGPAVIYHVQKTSSVFVIRTMVSQNLRQDYSLILDRPEDYPSLRLMENNAQDVATKLKFFMVENPYHAEIIHDQLHNRRFPINEEVMCNISDPGFSWWLSKKARGFQIAFTMSVASDENTVKLGPLGDRELAVRNFQSLSELIAIAGIDMNIQNETNRVQFTDCEEFILEELKDVFEFGVITQTLTDIFRIISKQIKDPSSLETTWFYLQELAAMRRFWIQVQFDLNAG